MAFSLIDDKTGAVPVVAIAKSGLAAWCESAPAAERDEPVTVSPDVHTEDSGGDPETASDGGGYGELEVLTGSIAAPNPLRNSLF